MDKNYDHLSTEDKLYSSWESSGVMRADVNSKKKPFTIPLPPPNVTGHLHLGHAAMLAIEDILIRFKKMTGHEALWIPGTDHAAIATENVVLKHLNLKNREDMNREDFLEECKKFATQKHDRIVHQIRKMGAWLDWSREAYTFDEQRNHAVNTVFKQLYDDGLIVRGHRMINWSVGAQSVLSDDEVQWEDGKTTFYEFWCGPFLIGTVRMETKCADSPVVVHPTAKYVRAQNAEGKECIVTEKYFKGHTKLKKDFEIKEIVSGKKLVGMKFEAETYAGKRKFWVIADDIIDPEFGTGAMTISTAHDPHDFELAQKHGLDLIQKIDFKGKMTDIAGPCKGMTVLEARKKSGEILEEKHLLFEKRPYANRIPVCYRSGTVVEPMLSPQWFIAVDKEFTDKFTKKKTTLKHLMQEAVRDKHVKIIPKQFEKVYFHWIDNLRDWCISRQIWWGHRIPVWYDEKGEIATVGETKNPDKNWKQDEDTLDTWFSSALWPCSILGWPDESNADYLKFYPTNVLETGHDILFFWVARMIMFGRYATGAYPFHTVYLHGLVTDEHGKKMSKSAGNGIDPLDVIEKYGADAARLSLVVGTSPGQPIPLGEGKISGYRNFVNKMWNAGRFVQMQSASVGDRYICPLPEPKSLADRWIASRFTQVAKEVAKHLEKYEISLAGDKIYHFIWDEFCDWYIEASKIEKNPKFLKHIFGEILKLAHPLCPFITEALWEELFDTKEFLILQEFPSPTYYNEDAWRLFKWVQGTVSEIRFLRAEHKINPNKKIQSYISGATTESLQEALKYIYFFSNSAPKLKKDKNDVLVSFEEGVEIFIDSMSDTKNIKKEKEELQKLIQMLESRLKNKGYTDKAPAHLVEQTRKELEEAKAKLKKM